MASAASLRLSLSPQLLNPTHRISFLNSNCLRIFRSAASSCSSSAPAASLSSDIPSSSSDVESSSKKWEGFRKKKVVMRVGYVGTDYRGRLLKEESNRIGNWRLQLPNYARRSGLQMQRDLNALDYATSTAGEPPSVARAHRRWAVAWAACLGWRTGLGLDPLSLPLSIVTCRRSCVVVGTLARPSPGPG
ncbi:hypothetical protein ACLOJK_031398 [Asimina triloba]